jgi:Transposase DDE domain
MVPRPRRDLAAGCNGASRALARTGVVAAKRTGLVDATDLDTTAQDEGRGHVTRRQKVTDKRGQVHEIEVTVYGWKLIVLIEARTKIPLAATVVPIQEHETLSLRALVTQARTNLEDHTCLPKVVFDKGFWDGPDLWWLDPHGITFVVPANANMAVTAEARAQAAAGEGMTAAVGCTPSAMGRATRHGSPGWRPRWLGSPG